jgi:hypothetical protein
MKTHNSERVSDRLGNGIAPALASVTRRTPAVSASKALLLAVVLAGCGSSDRPDNAAAFEAMHAYRSGDEVVVEGLVLRVEPSAMGPSGAHEHFTVRVVSAGQTVDVDVADNVTIGEMAPVKTGDDVIVKGVLEMDPSGPIIHWTHHDPELRHVSGFVEVGGNRYE